MKAPSKEIYCKSATCDFLLMVNSNSGCTYHMRGIFAYKRLRQFFAYCIQIIAP